MSENKIHQEAGYNQDDNIRPFVREWAQAVLSNPDKITVKTFTVKDDDKTRYHQVFAPAGEQAPYAYANSAEWEESDPCPIFHVRVMSTLEGDFGRITVPPVNKAEELLLTEAFKYWHPVSVTNRKKAKETFERETEAVRLAQLPAFTS